MTEKRKRGAQKGNQNARKHGFYSKALDRTQQLQLQEAGEVEGLDQEIAVLRVKLLSLIDEHPERVDLQIKAANTIASLVKIRYSISKEQKKSLKEAIAKVLTELAVPLGVKTFLK